MIRLELPAPVGALAHGLEGLRPESPLQDRRRRDWL